MQTSLLPKVHPQASSLIVLDTNVVLDCLVFNNRASMSIWSAVCEQKLQWIAAPAMREELINVLARGLRGPHVTAKWEALEPHWKQWVTEREEPVAQPAYFPQCTDKDDQIFINLALSQGARWLISRDRAVLKLARRCRLLGLSVLTPEQWVSTHSISPI